MKIKEKLKTGDVIYTDCVDIPLCQHLGIVYENNGEKMVYHNSPYNKNKFGGSVCCESYEDFIKDREILKVVRTNVKKEEIFLASNRCKSDTWDSMFFNCEDFVNEVVDGKRDSDLRDVYKVAALGIMIILLY
jgi:hypothetical protein